MARYLGPIPLAVAALAGLLIEACSDSAGPGATPECAGPVVLTATHSTTPVFTWTPVCKLFLVLVEDSTTGQDQWSVESDSSNAIKPSVTYGVLPPGTTKQLTAPTTLQSGQTYRADLFRFTGPGHEDGVLIAQLIFTP
jgi:hypothetical protein